MLGADLGLAAVLALVVAALLVGFAKTAIAGVGAIAVALFAFVLPARESTGAVLPLLIAGDVMALSLYRRHADWPALLRLLPGVLPGLALGAWFVGSVDNRVMRVAIGLVLLVMVGLQLWQRLGRRSAEPAAAGRQLGPTLVVTRALSMGVLAGFATMVANAAGPVTTLYLVMAGLPMLRMLGTGAWFFAVVNLAKLPFSVGLGLITARSLLIDLALVPALVAGGVVGVLVIRRIDQRQFEVAALALGGVAAALLLA